MDVGARAERRLLIQGNDASVQLHSYSPHSACMLSKINALFFNGCLGLSPSYMFTCNGVRVAYMKSF